MGFAKKKHPLQDSLLEVCLFKPYDSRSRRMLSPRRAKRIPFCSGSSRACHAAWQNAGRTNMGPVDIEARHTSTPSYWQAVTICSVAVLALKNISFVCP
jgi:hypothetical protein